MLTISKHWQAEYTQVIYPSGELAVSVFMKVVAAILVVLVLVVILVLNAPYNSHALGFNHQDQSLEGTLLLPEQGKGPYPLAVFVHGDGPMDRTSFGYYEPYFEALTKAGIAVYSWDKPGIGESSGDWLQQSMDDRSSELQSAINMLRNVPEIQGEKIGLIGFSQAGWVMPQVLSNDSKLVFGIFISTAINWLQQSHFQTKKRLQQDGLSSEQIDKALDFNRSLNQYLKTQPSYQMYVNKMRETSPEFYSGKVMSHARYEFVIDNLHADARNSLPNINQPILGLFGRSDSLVDIENSIRVYQERLNTFEYRVYDHADHGLFKDEYFEGLSKDSLWFLLKMHWLGEDGLADGVMDDIVRWSHVHFEL